MKRKHNAGFTLIEVVVAMAILAAAVLPVCGSMILALRVNAKAEAVLNARIAVSSAVEVLMAEGIDPTNNYAADARFENVTITLAENIPYYNVEVKDKAEGLVTVTTSIRAAQMPDATPDEVPEEEVGADE